MSESDVKKARDASILERLIASVKSLRGQANDVNPWPFRFAEDNEFRQRLGIVMQEISDTLTVLGLTEDLQRYPLLNVFQRPDSGLQHQKARAYLRLGQNS
jgi:hypothetical protein